MRPLGLALYQQAGCKTLILKLGERGFLTFRAVPPERRGRARRSSCSTVLPIVWWTRSAPATRCSPMRRFHLYATKQHRDRLGSRLARRRGRMRARRQRAGAPEGRDPTSSTASNGSRTIIDSHRDARRNRMRVVIVGYGVQGRKRLRVAGADGVRRCRSRGARGRIGATSRRSRWTATTLRWSAPRTSRRWRSLGHLLRQR